MDCVVFVAYCIASRFTYIETFDKKIFSLFVKY